MLIDIGSMFFAPPMYIVFSFKFFFYFFISSFQFWLSSYAVISCDCATSHLASEVAGGVILMDCTCKKSSGWRQVRRGSFDAQVKWQASKNRKKREELRERKDL